MGVFAAQYFAVDIGDADINQGNFNSLLHSVEFLY